ncbi:hypothetical protein ACWGLP_05185 [Streptomyces lydicus]
MTSPNSRDDASCHLARHRGAVDDLLRWADRLRATRRRAEARLAEEFSTRAQFAPDETVAAFREVLAQRVDLASRPAPPAAVGRYGPVQYVQRPGEVRVDGSRGWRTCNPGLLCSGRFASDYGAVADDDGIAVFPDERAGQDALAAFLGTEDVQGTRVAQILQAVRDREQPLAELWGPFDDLPEVLNLDPLAPLSTLSPPALAALAGGIATWSYRRRGGHRYLAGDRSAPAWVSELTGAARADGRSGGLEAGHRVRLAGRPAESYRGRSDICILTSFFNPCGYRSRSRNFLSFLQSLQRSGADWRCVECAFGDRPFELPSSDQVLQVRSNSVLWQKERLLNLLVRTLPSRYSKVAWIDGDVFFSEFDWLARTSELLAQYAVVQPFTEAIRLPCGQVTYDLRGDVVLSFAYRFHLNPNTLAWSTYTDHGHTGYAWAGRRDWIQDCGLYDACLSGTGDHLMAHAFLGDWDFICCGLRDSPLRRHFEGWADVVYPQIRSNMGYLDGAALSLWHGSQHDRNYHLATERLQDMSFDPSRDLRIGDNGCWEWGRSRSDLRRWADDYFRLRREDGDHESA